MLFSFLSGLCRLFNYLLIIGLLKNALISRIRFIQIFRDRIWHFPKKDYLRDASKLFLLII